MHDFLITIFLGLALFKVVDLVEDLIPGLTKVHTLATMVLAVAGTVFMDYSIFAGYHVGLRSSWMGAWVTGLMVAGTTTAWRALFRWLGSSEGEEPAVRHLHHARAA